MNINDELRMLWGMRNVRCPGCRLNWALFPPVEVDGDADAHRCIECKRVYCVSADGRAEKHRARALFQWGAFTGAAGRALPFKIECDSLTDVDWECVAQYGRTILPAFRSVVGVPRGGLKLAEAMREMTTPHGVFTLLVDDVWTTGKSMTSAAEDLSPSEPWIGYVAFKRGWSPPSDFHFLELGRSGR